MTMLRLVVIHRSKIKSKPIYIMSLLESKINSIAAIAIDTSLNYASIDYLNENYYNKSALVTALNSKQKNIVQAPATITLGQSADYTYFIDSNANSYPLFSSRDIVWSKYNNNISLFVSDEFKNAYLTTTSASSLYAHAEDVANFETAVSLLGDVYHTITGMSSYVTTGTLINNYATQLELSEKVDTTVFEQQLCTARLNAIQNSNTYTDGKISDLSTIYQTVDNMSTYVTSGSLITYVTSGTLLAYATSGSITDTLLSYLTINSASSTYQRVGNYITTFTALTGTYLSIIDASTTYQPSGNYLTNASLFQASGNYLTTASLFQASGNYLTNASLFQSAGNYMTTFTPLAGTYLSIINAQTTYQLAGNYITNASLFQSAGNYITTFTPLAGTYLSIIGASTTYQPVASMTNYITSGSLITYVTSGSLTTYVTSGSLSSYAPLASPNLTGTVSAPAITLNGTDTSSLYMLKPLIMCRFTYNGNGTFANIYSSGRTVLTLSNLTRNATGSYTFTGFTVPFGAMAFGGSGYNATGNRVATSFPTTSQLNVYIYNTSNVLTDGDACVFTIP